MEEINLDTEEAASSSITTGTPNHSTSSFDLNRGIVISAGEAAADDAAGVVYDSDITGGSCEASGHKRSYPVLAAATTESEFDDLLLLDVAGLQTCLAGHDDDDDDAFTAGTNANGLKSVNLSVDTSGTGGYATSYISKDDGGHCGTPVAAEGGGGEAGGLRKGKWTEEEGEFADRLVALFRAGLLPLHDGTTLRTFLAKVLNCDPMRISKKFVGLNSIGKQMYVRSAYYPPPGSQQFESTRLELATMEQAYIDKEAMLSLAMAVSLGGAGGKKVKDKDKDRLKKKKLKGKRGGQERDDMGQGAVEAEVDEFSWASPASDVATKKVKTPKGAMSRSSSYNSFSEVDIGTLSLAPTSTQFDASNYNEDTLAPKGKGSSSPSRGRCSSTNSNCSSNRNSRSRASSNISDGPSTAGDGDLFTAAATAGANASGSGSRAYSYGASSSINSPSKRKNKPRSRSFESNKSVFGGGTATAVSAKQQARVLQQQEEMKANQQSAAAQLIRKNEKEEMMQDLQQLYSFDHRQDPFSFLGDLELTMGTDNDGVKASCNGNADLELSLPTARRPYRSFTFTEGSTRQPNVYNSNFYSNSSSFPKLVPTLFEDVERRLKLDNDGDLVSSSIGDCIGGSDDYIGGDGDGVDIGSTGGSNCGAMDETTTVAQHNANVESVVEPISSGTGFVFRTLATSNEASTYPSSNCDGNNNNNNNNNNNKQPERSSATAANILKNTDSNNNDKATRTAVATNIANFGDYFTSGDSVGSFDWQDPLQTILESDRSDMSKSSNSLLSLSMNNSVVHSLQTTPKIIGEETGGRIDGIGISNSASGGEGGCGSGASASASASIMMSSGTDTNGDIGGSAIAVTDQTTVDRLVSTAGTGTVTGEEISNIMLAAHNSAERLQEQLLLPLQQLPAVQNGEKEETSKTSLQKSEKMETQFADK